MHRWCWCGFSASVLQRWYKICTNFIQISYEIHPQSASKIGTVNVVVTNFVRNWYEFRIIFARISNNLHEFVSFLSVSGCAWSERLLFVWAWVTGVCVSG